jgi:hypothetical protein
LLASHLPALDHLLLAIGDDRHADWIGGELKLAIAYGCAGAGRQSEYNQIAVHAEQAARVGDLN